MIRIDTYRGATTPIEVFTAVCDEPGCDAKCRVQGYSQGSAVCHAVPEGWSTPLRGSLMQMRCPNHETS